MKVKKMASPKKSMKGKKKQWYTIVAPKKFSGEPIGEAPAYEAESLIGRSMSVNLMALSNDSKKQNINIKFIIEEVQGDKAVTKVTGFEMIPTSIKRLVGKGRTRVDMSFMVKTKDGVNVRVKPLFIIKARARGDIARSLRKFGESALRKIIRSMDYDSLIADVIQHKVQSKLKDALKPVYPLRTCEVREIYIEKLSKNAPAEDAEPEDDEVKDDAEGEAVEEPSDDKSGAQEKAYGDGEAGSEDSEDFGEEDGSGQEDDGAEDDNVVEDDADSEDQPDDIDTDDEDKKE